MSAPSTAKTARRLRVQRLAALLAAALAGSALGGALHLAGLPGQGDAAWDATGASGAGCSLWTVIDSLRRSRASGGGGSGGRHRLVGPVGALATGEHLAAAAVATMLVTGRALESWAAGRARHDLQALLERAPRIAQRYTTAGLEAVPSSEVAPGDRLMGGSGAPVPVDGNLEAAALLDESAPNGEPLPVERAAREAVRSGVANARAADGATRAVATLVVATP